MAFSRELDDEKWIVVVNFTEDETSIDFDYSDIELVISNTDGVNVEDNKLSFQAYDAYVFRAK